MDTEKFNMLILCYTVILALCVVPKVPVEAIIKRDYGCSKIYSGSGGQILSPDYPQEYPNNLVCAWAIKAPYNSRIRLTFSDFKLERSDDCFDQLVVKDGIQSDSPVIGTYCASEAYGLSLTSSGNTLLLNFITDASLGDRGIKIRWQAISKVSLKRPTDGVFTGEWEGFDAPKDIIAFDAGLLKNTVWAIDNNNDIFFYDGRKWDIQPGKLQSITVGEAGIFGIHPGNQSIYWRYGARLENPKGYRWEYLSGNGRNIIQLESSHPGVLYGLDKQNNLLYILGDSYQNLDNKWRQVPLELENGGRIDAPLSQISCGMYSCFLTTKEGDVYGMTTPGDPEKAKWIHDFGNFRNVSVGFGNNVWALDGKGNMHKKDSVNNIHMLGKEWQRQYVNGKEIVAGLTGVYALAKDGSFGRVKDAICGGFLFASTGTISSPNYPSMYPPNLSCLWVIRPKGAEIIDLNFESQFEIKASPLCKDYLTTTYPGITEPIVECGKTVVDKRIQAEQVWIEFVSDESNEGIGFKINYESADPTPKSTSPPTVPKRGFVPPGWEIFKPDEYFEKKFDIKLMVPYSKSILWGLTDKGQAFIRAYGSTRLVYGNDLKSLATNGLDVWAIDGGNNLVFRTGVSGSSPEGVSWKVIEPYTLYKEIANGPAAHYIVLNDNNDLHHCTLNEKISPDCQFVAKDIKTSSSSPHGIWYVDNSDNLYFAKVVRKSGNKFDFIVKDLRLKVKDVKVTKTGDVWVVYMNDTLASRNGISAFKPHGLKWQGTSVTGKEIHISFDNVHVVLKDGQMIKLKDPVRSLPDNWEKIKSNINTPYKIDAYPKGDQIDVWVLGGLNGRIPYQGTYLIDGDGQIDFKRRGNTELKSLSVGESGVWGIGYDDLKVRFYDQVSKRWLTLPNDDKNWDTIESASPLYNVYAIDYEFSELYFREGISADNPLGTKWVYIGLSATQVSSGTHGTYIVTDNGALKSFAEPPTSDNLKTWISSLKSYLNEVENTFSVGFGGVVAFLDEENDVVERNILLPKDEFNDKKWIWGLNKNVRANDISAGPVIFGLVGNDIIAKKVTTCFGYYHDSKDPVTVQLRKTPPGLGKCTWVVTTSRPTTMNALITRQNIADSDKCSSGGLFYSTNHDTPLLGEFKGHCGNRDFKQIVKGNRMFFQYFKQIPLSPDELEMRFDVFKADSGCGGTFRRETGRISSPNYPKNYPNNQDCISIIKTDPGKLIQLTIEKMDIEYGGTTCDYDYLQINDGEYASDRLIGKLCGKKSNLKLTSSSNTVRILFKSDDSGNTPGFFLTWKTVTDRRITTAKPAATTPFSACGGRFTQSSGQFASPNWPQNYPTNKECKWYITVPVGKRVTLTLKEFDVEDDQQCLYDNLIVFDGLVASSRHLDKVCGKKMDYQIQSSGNEMLVIFRSDSSTVAKGFLIEWSTEDPRPTILVTTAKPVTIEVPSNWDKIHDGYKFDELKSDYKGIVWAINKNDKKIYTIDKDGTPPTLLSNLADVYALTLGKYSVQKNGAWALAGPNRDIYFFNISNYDKEPWEKVSSIDGSKNVDIVTTPFKTFLIKEDGHIFYRRGVTKSNPKGDQWYLYERGNGIDEGTFGTWIITRDGNLKFRKHGTRELINVRKPESLLSGRSDPRAEKPFTQVATGYGNKVYAVIDNELFERVGVSFINPSGVGWKSTGVQGVKDVTVNNFGVFVLLIDDGMVKLDDIFCGGILTNKDGQITYPEFQNSYTPNQYCMWYLKLDGIDEIVFTQRRFDLEYSQDCKKDRVTIGATQNIQNGLESSSFCGAGMPDSKLVVKGDKAFIEFISDGQVNSRGFSFDYSGKSRDDTVKECGGEFRSDTGRFQSKRYPRSYSPNGDCEWKIATRENTRILITFDDMNIKAGSDCGKSDFLQVFDGSSKSSTILKIYCNENAPQSVRSSGNKVLIRFKSDGSGGGRGFSGNWRAEPIKPGQLGCGDTFTASSGSILSPNFPDKYNNYADCSYLIRLKPGKTITLKFAKFSVESSTSCDRDFVKIYNVNEDGNRRLAKTLCGSEAIEDFESDGNGVDVEFKSDGTTPYPGFDIRYLDSDLVKNPVYPSGWTEVPTPQKVFVQIDAVVESSGAWAMDSRGYPYHYNAADKKWTVADNLSSDMSLTPGKYGVYAVKRNGELYFRDGISSLKPEGKYWRRIIPDNNLLTSVDYGAYGELVAINEYGDVLVRQGVIPVHKPQGDKWKVVARGFKSISLGSYGYWLVDGDDNVFFGKYVPSGELDQLSLTQVNGKFRKVSAGFGGNVWAIDRDNRVFMRLKVNFLNPSGTMWSKVPDILLSDIASGYDAVYGITLAGKIVRYTESYCGGLSSTPSGSFSSPNFPLYYPANSNCLYIIYVPGYNKIVTDVVQFALESSTDCRKDYLLTSKDGQFPSKEAIQKNCGRDKANIPRVFKDKVWFEFFSDGSSQDIGFFIEWKASREPTDRPVTIVTRPTTTSDGLYRACGGTINGDEGTIVHPNYPRSYANSRNCRYAITVDPDKVIRLKFEMIDMEDSDTCRYDYIEVVDSFNYETKRYCKYGRHNDFISFGRSLVINFKTDQGGVRDGFRIRWIAVDPTQERITVAPTSASRVITTLQPTEEIIVNRDCGKVYRDFSGYIYHPSYPMGYRNNLDCIWTVVVPRGDRINFEFQFFKIESSANCENDFVAIYDGASDQAPLVNKFCGRETPAAYTSKKNIASVRIKTNEKVTMNGFVVLYKRVTPDLPITAVPREECGADYTDRLEGYITTPNYPSNYDNDRDCFYTVTVKENMVVNAQFIDFDLENSPQCSYDSVQLRSGGNVNSRSIGKFCGSKLPQVLRTSGNKLFVRFRSDGQNNNKGFKLYWKEEAPTSQACRYDESGDSGIIISPGYPNDYQYNQDCFWYITGTVGRNIQVQFEDFELETCPFDYVRIIDGNNVQGKVLGKYCGSNIPGIVTTTSNKMIIHFRSDDKTVRKGFKLRWKSQSIKVPQIFTTASPGSSRDCIFDLTGKAGTITHPSYPEKYKINKDCKWRITVGYGKKIQIRMKEMDIEYSQNCDYDFLQIKDGLTDGASELGKFCGTNLPTPVSSTGNKLMVRFVSDDQYTKKGFKLEWREISVGEDGDSDASDCKFNLSGYKGEIKSPNYPLKYDHNKNCGWLITVPKGYSIKLNFKELDIEPNTHCSHDSLSIRDGADDSSDLITTLCGVEIPYNVRSSGNNMYLNFKTNDQIAGKGFKIAWEAVKHEDIRISTTFKPQTNVTGDCYKELDGQYGEIKSPNYPSNYDVDKDCYWKISSPPRTTIQITFVDIDTESSLRGTCYDFIEIYDGSNKNDRSLGKFCGRNKPQNIIKSRGNRMLVRFYSDDRTPKKGFRLTWEARSKLKVASSKCEKEAESINKGNSFLRGAFTPQCRDDGLYEKKQCHSSTGYCWCVGIVEGREVIGTRKGPGRGEPVCVISKCEQEIIEAKKAPYGPGAAIGAFTPECKENGDYEKKQCHGSTGYCWCVDPITGRELSGTRKGPGAGDPECHLSECQRIRKSKINLPGAFVPTCKVDGSYENKQCHSSIGHCWCVESKTGKEIAGTRKRRGEGQPACGLSKCQREAAEVTATGPDVYRVKCKPDGSYYRKQCYAQRGSCWCVDPETGKEIEGTWRGPKDGSPKCGDEDKCNPACPYNYEPVCGSNGKSYSNKCLFKYEKCQNPSLTLRYEGECTGVDDCNRACGFNWDPVCGSDGTSYSNPCTFKVAQCKNPSMKIAYSGTCTDGGECKRACPYNYEPVCGSDGVSYSNECVRKLAECKDSSIKFAYKGNCKDCLIVCPYNYEPVCGSDGKTYSNPCNLKNAQCEDSSIQQISNGKCGSVTTTLCENKACTKEFKPVCGSDKNTYNNFCLLQLAQCTDSSIFKAYDGRCKDDGFSGCDRVLTDEQGTITHRNAPDNYRPNQDCTYTIRAPFNNRIVFYFQKFDVEDSTDCINDYLSITDGADDRNTKKYCGRQYPGIIRSTSGSLKIRFKTNDRAEGKGFSARYYFERVQPATEAPTQIGDQPLYRSSHRLSGETGVVAHPGYPSNYENNVYSTWLIETDPANKINLYFDSFMLQSDTDCLKDYVEIYDGSKTTDRRIGRYCSSNPGRITSSGNEMLIVFRSDAKVTDSGFFARWNTEKRLKFDNRYDICGTRTVKFDGNQIEVHSPNFNGYSKYPRNRNCVLQLTHLPNTVFNLEIVRFDLQRPTPFCRDYLSIRDGDNKKSKELGRMCGQNVLKKKLSTSDNKIFLEFVSDGTTEDKGFSLYISSADRPRTQVELTPENQCGQSITGQRGTITNPTTLPDSVQRSVCVWKIETSPGSQVQLKFDLINLSDDCDKSYILLREGENSNSPVLQKLCGYKNEVRLSTQSNKLWMEYKTPHSDIGQFVMRWSEDGAKDFQCGGTVTGRRGYLYSPFYPKTFDDDVFCLWIILAEPNKRISLKLQDTRLGPNCGQSYSIIRDGMTSGSKSLGKFCSNAKNEVVSTGNALWVELKATCITNKAFKAFWATVEDGGSLPDGQIITNEKSPGVNEGGISVVKVPKDEQKKTTSGVTRKTYPETVQNVFGATMITASKGVIKSPYFPKNYPHDHMKVWILRGPKSGKIRLQFTTFDIESDSHCLYDYVEVRDGGFAASPPLGRFCGEKLPDILQSTGDKLWIKFRSDSSTHASGFSADWKWTESDSKGLSSDEDESNTNVCGGVYTSGTGVITSPSFPDLYPNNMECVYIIKPPQAQSIRLVFDNFNLEADYKCTFDFLEVKEGSDQNGKTLAKLCQNNIPNPVISKKGAFWIRFRSDVTTQRQGFSASWTVLDNTVQ